MSLSGEPQRAVAGTARGQQLTSRVAEALGSAQRCVCLCEINKRVPRQPPPGRWDDIKLGDIQTETQNPRRDSADK